MQVSKPLFRFISIYVFAGLILNSTNAQNVMTVPGQSFSQNYPGNPTIYNNNLFIRFLVGSGTYWHLALANGGGLSIIPNPDNSYGYIGSPIIYNNKLYTLYQSATGNQLAVYDGISLTLIPNPPNTFGYYGYPVVYNNKLYLDYLVTQTTQQLFEFDGTNFSSIVSPTGTELLFGVPYSYPIIYNSKLYLEYRQGSTSTSPTKLAEFDGSTITILPTPQGGVEYDGSPIIFNNKLYLDYGGILAEYDGVNPITIIPNPENTGYIVLTSDPYPTIFNNKLYVAYYKYPATQLAEFDGNALTLVSNPDAGQGYTGNPLVFNNQLYFGYTSSTGNVLARYDGTAISIIPNPTIPSLHLYNNQLALYHNSLYLGYQGPYGTYRYNGTSLSIVPDVAGRVFNGYSTIFNDTLFFADRYNNTNNNNYLAYIGNITLPIKLLNFSAQLQNNSCVLNWQTASEENTSYFSIERSTDGRTFDSINEVGAAGNNNTTHIYNYTDENVTSFVANQLYYRLKETDKDGLSTYSKILKVNLEKSNTIFSISPNPTKDFINIVSSKDIRNAQIKVASINGKTLYSTKQNLTSGQQLKIEASKFSKGILIVMIEADNIKKEFKIIKE